MTGQQTLKIRLSLSGGTSVGYLQHLALYIVLDKIMKDYNAAGSGLEIKIEEIAATSAGSIIGALIAAGVKPEEILRTIPLTKDIYPLDHWPTWKQPWLSSCGLSNALVKSLENKTFGDEGVVPLNIPVADITQLSDDKTPNMKTYLKLLNPFLGGKDGGKDYEYLVFNKNDTPDYSLRNAVVRSCAMPGIFPFWELLDKTKDQALRYVLDGSLGRRYNQPTELLHREEGDIVIESYCGAGDARGFRDILSMMWYSFFPNYTHKTPEEPLINIDKTGTIRVNSHCDLYKRNPLKLRGKEDINFVKDMAKDYEDSLRAVIRGYLPSA